MALARSTWLWLAFAVVAALGILASLPSSAPVVAAAPAAPVDDAGHRDRYVGSRACARCHAEQHASWHDTFHRTMTQRPSPDTVAAAFDGERIGPHRIGSDEAGYWVESPQRRRVELVTGSHHMQVYWTRAGDDDRLEAFPYAYLLPERRWVTNEATLLRPERANVRYTWNRVCIKCHAVAGTPGLRDQTVRTEVAELGIACEACHGPGRAHAEVQRNPLRRLAQRFDATPDDTIVHPERLDPDAASQVCGQCHSITVFHDDGAWVERGHQSPPPEPIAAWGKLVRHPARADQPWLDPLLEDDAGFLVDRFWSDGMVRVSGREYNGLVESSCHRGGLSCLTCHSMHDAPADDQLFAGGDDDACLECHAAIAADPVAHTHHAPSSSGSRCVNCHMPHTTYGLLKAIRSHTIDSPSARVARETGRPDACSLCHRDRPLAWTAEHLANWYGQSRPAPTVSSDAAAPSAYVEWLLRGDAGQRAIAAWHAGWAPAHEASGRHWVAPLVAQLLDDPYPAVRIVAARALRQLPGLADIEPDPEAPAPDRRRAVAQVVRRWARASTADRRGPAVLTDEAGDLDADAMRRLVADRDETPVTLAE